MKISLPLIGQIEIRKRTKEEQELWLRNKYPMYDVKKSFMEINESLIEINKKIDVIYLKEQNEK